MARFESLLNHFGLIDRMILPGQPVDPARLNAAIDWDKVTRILENDRFAAREFLAYNLNP